MKPPGLKANIQVNESNHEINNITIIISQIPYFLLVLRNFAVAP